MIALAVYGIVFDELRDLILSGKLSRDDLAGTARELGLLDRGFPRNAHSMMNGAAMEGFGFLKVDTGEMEMRVLLDGMPWAGWRYGFSSRLLLADAFDTDLDFMKRCAEREERPWAEAGRMEREMEGEIAGLRNPVSRMMIPGLLQGHRAGRDRRAQLRLLRVAAHYRATGEILDLDDPFGAKLLTSRTGDRLKVWSVGRYGVDGSGLDDWKPTPGRDIALEVDR